MSYTEDSLEPSYLPNGKPLVEQTDVVESIISSFRKQTSELQSLQSFLHKKDEQIKQLTEENNQLKAQLRAKSPDRFILSRGDFRQRAQEARQEFRKAYDNFDKILEESFSFDSTTSNTSNRCISLQGPSNSIVEVSSESDSIIRPSDEHDTLASSSSNSALNHRAQEFRPLRNEPDSINEVTEMNLPLQNLPTPPPPPPPLNNHHTSQRRFTPLNTNTLVNGSNNHNNNNNNRNNNRKQNTVFVSWSGTMDSDSLRELFDQNDISDIRYTPNKQFAHVDLKSTEAMKKAIELNGLSKGQHGVLRVEAGRPKSSNNNNNNNNGNNNNDNNNNNNNNGGVRPHQNKPYPNRQPNKNGNTNGYVQQKHNNGNTKYYPNNLHNNNLHNLHNSNHNPYNNTHPHNNGIHFPQDDKDRINSWKPYADSSIGGQSTTTSNSVAASSS